jgi:GNAT superfamily N-acetyltransferase
MHAARVELVERFPDAEDYCRLRAEAGMAPRTIGAAQRGLPNTLYGVSLLCGDEVVGMGRVIGDGGCFFIVVDIAVTPSLQGQGLGKRIMGALDAWLRANAPASAVVSLAADGDAKHLYARYGFVDTTDGANGQPSVNMEYQVE